MTAKNIYTEGEKKNGAVYSAKLGKWIKDNAPRDCYTDGKIVHLYSEKETELKDRETREKLAAILKAEKRGEMNMYGATPYSDGEIIDAQEKSDNGAVLRGLLTCINSLISIAKIKRDKIANSTIQEYLDRVIDCLRYIRYNARIDGGKMCAARLAYGAEIWRGYADITEIVSEIDGAYCVLCEYNGAEMSREIVKKLRNGYALKIDEKERRQKDGIEKACKYYRGYCFDGYTALPETLQKVLAAAVAGGLDVPAARAFVYVKINGYTQAATAELLNVSQGCIAKMIKRAAPAIAAAVNSYDGGKLRAEYVRRGMLAK